MIKLLVVDNEKGLCDYLKGFFSLRGLEVFIATSAEDALTIVKEESPQLVLLDINMPGTNGLEALRLIKEASSRTKVVMVSVNDDQDTRDKAKALGADDFVRKPFTTDYLEDVVMLKINESIASREPPKILIVDDEEEVRVHLRRFLERRVECLVSEAASGDEALALLAKDKFDLVFLDIKMPGKSGLDVLKEKKALDYKPVFWVITAFDSEEMAHKVVEQGADDYITKPLSLRVLDSKVRNFLASIGKYKPTGVLGSEK